MSNAPRKKPKNMRNCFTQIIAFLEISLAASKSDVLKMLTIAADLRVK